MLPPLYKGTQRRWPTKEQGILWALLAVSLLFRIALAGSDLSSDYAWDERYSIANVNALLDGEGIPANGFYPALSYLPQVALLGSLETSCRAWSLVTAEDPPSALCDLRRKGGLTPAGYFWCRLLSVLFGVLSIWWLARLSQRLFAGRFGSRIGLVAAAFLAMMPWHLRQSSVFKPDALLLLLFIVACDAALLVAASPVLRRYLVAGIVVGFAAATKYNGVAAAVPVTIATLLAVRRQPRRLAYLVGAGIAAASTFVLLQLPVLMRPWLLDDFDTTLADYGRKSAAAGISPLEMPWTAASQLASDRFHGAVIFILAASGLAALAVVAWQATGRRREELAVVLSLPFGYLALYAVVTSNPAEHNWLPVTPFTSLAAAWLLAFAARAAARRRPSLTRTAPVALLLIAAGSSLVAARYTYSAAVPTTWSEAERHLLTELPPGLVGRLVVYEPWEDNWLRLRRQRWNRPTVVSVESLGQARYEVEEKADALVLQVAPDRFAYVAPHQRGELIEPAPARRRGPPLRVAVRPWRCTARPFELQRAQGVYAVPDPRPAGNWVSFLISARAEADAAAVDAELAGSRLRLFNAPAQGGEQSWLSERVAWQGPSGDRELRILGLAPGAVTRVVLSTWEPPGGGPPHLADCP